MKARDEQVPIWKSQFPRHWTNSLPRPNRPQICTSPRSSPALVDGTRAHGRRRTHLEDSNGIRVWEIVQDDRTLLATESDALNAVQICICPVDPLAVHSDAVGPLHILRHETIGSRAIHVAPVNPRLQVSPVSPEHHPGQQREHTVSSEGGRRALILFPRGSGIITRTTSLGTISITITCHYNI